MWNVIQTEEFWGWFQTIDNAAQEDIVTAVTVLKEFGPRLGRPQVDTLDESKLANLKELRVQSKGRPFRILFVFDPKRNAVLLVGGNKEGQKRFYKIMIKKAEEIYQNYLEELNEEENK